MNRLVVAIDRRRGVGKKGFQPWYIPIDEKLFTDLTKSKGGITLTGITTFKTFHGPLKDRQNFIVTSQTEPIAGVELVNDLPKFLNDFRDKDVWVVGGASIFAQVMEAGMADELYITFIDADFGCDRFLPEYEDKFQLVEKGEPQEQNGFHFYFAKYAKT